MRAGKTLWEWLGIISDDSQTCVQRLGHIIDALRAKPPYLFLGVVATQALALLAQRADLVQQLLRAIARYPVAMSISLTLATVILGATASYWKHSAQASYGLTEIAFGAVVSYNLIDHIGTSFDFSKFFGVCSTIYVIGRGFNNLSDAVKALPSVVHRFGRIIVIKDHAGPVICPKEDVEIRKDVSVCGEVCGRSVSLGERSAIRGNVSADGNVWLGFHSRLIGDVKAGKVGLLSGSCLEGSASARGSASFFPGCRLAGTVAAGRILYDTERDFPFPASILFQADKCVLTSVDHINLWPRGAEIFVVGGFRDSFTHFVGSEMLTRVEGEIFDESRRLWTLAS